MAVPEGVDFYYEITQWESGKIFHYRYLLDDNNDIIREKRFDEEPEIDESDAIKDGKAFKVQVKQNTKIIDPQASRKEIQGEISRTRHNIWPHDSHDDRCFTVNFFFSTD